MEIKTSWDLYKTKVCYTPNKKWVAVDDILEALRNIPEDCPVYYDHVNEFLETCGIKPTSKG